MKKEETIKRYGEAAWEKLLAQGLEGYTAHKKEEKARSKRYYEEHKEEAKAKTLNA
jgi:hypothetical protein